MSFTSPANELAQKTLSLHRKALGLKTDPDGGRYVSGLKEVRIRTAEDGKKILKLGQLNRRVFGTLANQASSRSHAIFTIKVLRVSKNDSARIDGMKTSRFCIVDLAGSERTKNTHNIGERLKEAGNINKSLMVLGQCLETLRSNQAKLANRRIGTAVRLAVVPFRHSKLTELFQDFFAGCGKAVMVVNINPYDTGFEENSRVMEFSALARQVTTNIAEPINDSGNSRNRRRTVKVAIGNAFGNKSSDWNGETTIEVLEEDAELDTASDDDMSPINPLVDALFDEIESLRARLHESELRAALIEADVREELYLELIEQRQSLEQNFADRLFREAEQSDRKMNQKLDILQKAKPLHRPNRAVNLFSECDTENAETGVHPISTREYDHSYQRSISPADSSEPSHPPSPTPVKRTGPIRANYQPGDLGLFVDSEDSASETDASESNCTTSVDVSEDDELDDDAGYTPSRESSPDIFDGPPSKPNYLYEPVTPKKSIRVSRVMPGSYASSDGISSTLAAGVEELCIDGTPHANRFTTKLKGNAR